jgi:hypothetical protein
VLPSLDEEALHRELLERLRRGLVLLEDTIALDEQLEKEGLLVSPFSLAELREEVVKRKKYLREVERWEQQRKLKPGRETNLEAIGRLQELRRELWPPPSPAPMPREKK